MPPADSQPTAPDAGATAEAAAEPTPVAGITIHGDATPEQVAALVAVLAAASGGAGEEAAGPASQWADHSRAVRKAATHGRGAWRASAQPR